MYTVKNFKTKKEFKKVYIPMKGCKGHYVMVYRPCEEKDCTICNNLKEFLSPNNPCTKDDPHRSRNVGLATINLQNHRASGKHWRLIDTYYTGEAKKLLSDGTKG